jgi:hypothetical protein
VEKYRSCWLPPLVYSGPLVHLAKGMLGIFSSSTLVPLRSKYYLEYKVCVYVILVHYLLAGLSFILMANTLVKGPDKDR